MPCVKLIGLVGTGTKLYLALVAASALLGLLVFSAALALSTLYRWPQAVAPLLGVATAVASFFTLRAAAGEVWTWLTDIISTAVSPGEEEEEDYGGEDVDDNEYDEYDDDDSVFLVYYLITNVAKEIYRHIRQVRLIAYTDDLVIFYPNVVDYGDENEEEEDYRGSELEEPEEPEAELNGESLTVKLPAHHFHNLARIAKGGDGEVAIVSSEDELRSLYLVAKAIAEAEIDDEGLASYSAYKAVLRMAKESKLEVPQRLMDLMPFESRELRRKVREQVMEEGMI
ncbi:MAG: hypothetical protein RXQ79_02910 [Acidilobus sp.]